MVCFEGRKVNPSIISVMVNLEKGWAAGAYLAKGVLDWVDMTRRYLQINRQISDDGDRR